MKAGDRVSVEFSNHYNDPFWEGHILAFDREARVMVLSNQNGYLVAKEEYGVWRVGKGRVHTKKCAWCEGTGRNEEGEHHCSFCQGTGRFNGDVVVC